LDLACLNLMPFTCRHCACATIADALRRYLKHRLFTPWRGAASPPAPRTTLPASGPPAHPPSCFPSYHCNYGGAARAAAKTPHSRLACLFGLHLGGPLWGRTPSYHLHTGWAHGVGGGKVWHTPAEEQLLDARRTPLHLLDDTAPRRQACWRAADGTSATTHLCNTCTAVPRAAVRAPFGLVPRQPPRLAPAHCAAACRMAARRPHQPWHKNATPRWAGALLTRAWAAASPPGTLQRGDII